MGNNIIIIGNYPNGEWIKRELDSNGNRIYWEDSDGCWERYEYNSNGNKFYYENSIGDWSKYDSNGNIIDQGTKDLFPTPEQIKEFMLNKKRIK